PPSTLPLLHLLYLSSIYSTSTSPPSTLPLLHLLYLYLSSIYSTSPPSTLPLKPKHGKKKPGRPHLTYTDLLKKDTGLELSEVKAAMLDRNVWKAITARAVDPT
ncbi:uncharacterized protein LOC115922828, partial [Strongylocentrotus purpuratus]|uniref:Uncharacterized protein n=1 Tax=Strongylocentrotus purpuratus TaxID=7668 RepID=A0A7M7NLS9_STRPU